MAEDLKGGSERRDDLHHHANEAKGKINGRGKGTRNRNGGGEMPPVSCPEQLRDVERY